MKITQVPVLIAIVVAGFANAIAGNLADSPSALARAQAGSAIQWHAWDAGTLAIALSHTSHSYLTSRVIL
jgi:hypothetical protein